MALTPKTLEGFLSAFNTYVDASNWDAAEKELLKAEVQVQTLPDTDQARWAGALTTAWTMLQRVRDRDQDTTGILIHAALRRKTRSTRSDD